MRHPNQNVAEIMSQITLPLDIKSLEVVSQRIDLQTYQQIDPEMKYQRGLLAALRTNPNNLTVKRLNRRERYLQQQPVIAAIYS